VGPDDVVAAADRITGDIEARGHHVCLGYQGVSTVYASDEAASPDWLTRFFEGYFQPSEARKGGITVYATGDPTLLDSLRLMTPPPVADDGGDVRIPLTDSATLVRTQVGKGRPPEDVFHLLFKEERRIVLVTPGDPEIRREQARRTVRAASKWLLLEQGWIPMHSACAAKDGRAVCVIGQKASGKTSTLLNLLARNGCDLVAVDKFLIRDAGSHVEVCGTPGRIGIRVGSAIAQPQVLEWLARPADSFFPHLSAPDVRHIAATNTPEQLRTRKEKVHMIPAELAGLFGRRITPTAPLGLLLIPVFDPDSEAARLDRAEPEQAARMLGDAYVSLHSKGEDFLLDFFDLSDGPLRDRLGALLGKHLPGIPAYELHQSHRTNPQAAELVADLLRSAA
jgi:hypothetical protein